MPVPGGRRWLALAVVLAAVGLVWTVRRAFWGGPLRRSYVIGWEAPTQDIKPNGEPESYGALVVSEAARRRGIHLRWERRTEGPEAALHSRAVDLWPLMNVTPERQRILHFPPPYSVSEYVFLVRTDGPFRRARDLTSGSISHRGTPGYRQILKRHFPAATSIEANTVKDAIADVCSNRAQAALVDLRSVLLINVSDPPCSGRDLRLVPDQGLQFVAGLAATPEAAAAADALRGEIDEMAQDGTLANIMSEAQHSPGGDFSLISSIRAARIRARQYQLGLAVIGVLLFLAVLLALRFRHARNALGSAQRELRQRERELRLVADSLNEMVIACDMQRRVIYTNPAVTRITGYSRDELDSMRYPSLIHPADRADLEVRWNRLFDGESFAGQEYRLIAKDGSEKWISASWGPLRDENGAQIGVRGCERDMTAQKRIEQTLEQAQRDREMLAEQLRQAQKLESIGRLAGGIAHDFNNLLTVINGYCKLILGGNQVGERIREQLEQINNAGERAASLTQQLLAFSRKQIIQPEVLDLNAAVRDSEKLLHRLLGEDIECATFLAPGLGKVLADPGQISQVILNLAVNARDAMPNGGKLVIETTDLQLGEGRAAPHGEIQPGSYVMLAVSDTGHGMDEQTQRMIFEPFFTTKPKDKGTGLGLATVYGIVKQNGGSIQVHSEIGKGTTFRVYLPRCDA